MAGSSGGAQFYPACFQINLSGSGNASPPTVRFPGAYAANDPGILVNIHQSLATYKSTVLLPDNYCWLTCDIVPGPTPYGSSPATVANSPYPTTATWNTAQQPQTVPTVVPGGGGSPTSAGTTVINTTPTPTPTSGGGGGTVALYGQCGGVSRNFDLGWLYTDNHSLDWLDRCNSMRTRQVHSHQQYVSTRKLRIFLTNYFQGFYSQCLP